VSRLLFGTRILKLGRVLGPGATFALWAGMQQGDFYYESWEVLGARIENTWQKTRFPT
jgi:hypothetical protein